MKSTEWLEQWKNQPIAVINCRYNYRGILTVIGEDFIVLSQAFVVNTSGAVTNEKPTDEEPIHGDKIIMLGALESAWQPIWCFYGYDEKFKKGKFRD